MHFARVLLAFLLATLLSLAHAQTELRLTADTSTVALRPHLEVLEDVNGQLKFEDMERPEIAGNFQTIAGSTDLNFGYTASTYWLRLKLSPEANTRRSWLLAIAYPSLDEVKYFTRQGDEVIQQAAGDRQPFAARPFAHHNLVFPVDLTPGIDQTIYLRIRDRKSGV